MLVTLWSNTHALLRPFIDGGHTFYEQHIDTVNSTFYRAMQADYDIITDSETQQVTRYTLPSLSLPLSLFSLPHYSEGTEGLRCCGASYCSLH